MGQLLFKARGGWERVAAEAFGPGELVLGAVGVHFLVDGVSAGFLPLAELESHLDGTAPGPVFIQGPRAKLQVPDSELRRLRGLLSAHPAGGPSKPQPRSRPSELAERAA